MKKIIKRFLFGAILGIAINYLISIFISFYLGSGNFQAVQPSLIEVYGNEINAVLIQLIFSMLIGGVYSASSIIFENVKYSLAKQSIIHFCLTTPIFFLVSYMMYWIDINSKMEILIFIGIYILIYFINWIIFYLYWKDKVNKLNNQIKKNNNI